MKKSEIEIEMSTELILVLVGLVILLLLIAGILLNLENLGIFFEETFGEIF